MKKKNSVLADSGLDGVGTCRDDSSSASQHRRFELLLELLEEEVEEHTAFRPRVETTALYFGRDVLGADFNLAVLHILPHSAQREFHPMFFPVITTSFFHGKRGDSLDRRLGFHRLAVRAKFPIFAAGLFFHSPHLAAAIEHQKRGSISVKNSPPRIFLRELNLHATLRPSVPQSGVAPAQDNTSKQLEPLGSLPSNKLPQKRRFLCTRGQEAVGTAQKAVS